MCRLELELRRVRRVLDPLLLGHGRFADMIHADRVIDVLHVAPSIRASIFQPEAHRSRIRRIVLDVPVLDSFAITRHENFDRGMRVTVGALV